MVGANLRHYNLDTRRYILTTMINQWISRVWGICQQKNIWWHVTLGSINMMNKLFMKKEYYRLGLLNLSENQNVRLLNKDLEIQQIRWLDITKVLIFRLQWKYWKIPQTPIRNSEDDKNGFLKTYIILLDRGLDNGYDICSVKKLLWIM